MIVTTKLDHICCTESDGQIVRKSIGVIRAVVIVVEIRGHLYSNLIGFCNIDVTEMEGLFAKRIILHLNGVLACGQVNGNTGHVRVQICIANRYLCAVHELEVHSHGSTAINSHDITSLLTILHSHVEADLVGASLSNLKFPSQSFLFVRNILFGKVDVNVINAATLYTFGTTNALIGFQVIVTTKRNYASACKESRKLVREGVRIVYAVTVSVKLGGHYYRVSLKLSGGLGGRLGSSSSTLSGLSGGSSSAGGGRFGRGLLSSRSLGGAVCACHSGSCGLFLVVTSNNGEQHYECQSKRNDAPKITVCFHC